MNSETKIQGEGDKESAKKYNKDQKEFVEKNEAEIEEKARDAKADLDDKEKAEELESARQEGASRAKEHDPAVTGKP